MSQHVPCIAVIVTMALIAVVALFFEWRTHNRCEKLRLRANARLADIDELRTAIAELTRERIAWISENAALRSEIAEWHTEAERRIVDSQEGSHV